MRNVHAGLGLPDAQKRKIEAGSMIEIRKAVGRLRATRESAAHCMGVGQAKRLRMMGGDFSNLSERKRMDCLNRLGYGIEIKPANEAVGRLRISAV